MTTFIDFRYSRTLAAALFTGEEAEESEIRALPGEATYVAVDAGDDPALRDLCRLTNEEGDTLVVLRASGGSVGAWNDNQLLASVACRGAK